MDACCSNTPEKVEHITTLGITDALFWRDLSSWKRAGRNTLNCLIGCSIGDFSMFFYLQHYHPQTPMWAVMVLSMTAGLLTSITLETILLKLREGFDWQRALKVAFSMSFISMLAMELTENVVNLALTGGGVSAQSLWFWIALALSLVAGFLVPLPYNYYQLAKHGKACH